MTAIQLSKSWSINPNVRNVFSTLTDMAGWFIYQNHTWLITHAWTVKWTSNGSVGPASSGDTTDRIISNAAASVRGTASATPQSWTVLQNPDGLQLLIAYQGAGTSPTGDDIIRISYSPGGLFTPQGFTNPTYTYQPTATDEVVVSTGNSIINSTASADRVMSIWASDDGKAWSCALWRTSVLLALVGVERVISYCETGVQTLPYFGYRYNSLIRSNSPGGNGPTWDPTSTAVGATGWIGGTARVLTDGASRLTRFGGGELSLSNIPNNGLLIEDVFLSNTPALQAGTMPLLPLFLTGEKAASLDGFFGAPYDWWIGYSASLSVPAAADIFPGFDVADNPNIDPVRSNWFVALGTTVIRPWKNVAVSMQIT
jgi:hypothetical protein